MIVTFKDTKIICIFNLIIQWHIFSNFLAVIIKEKRIRENRRLHKILTPKNALMALNELKSDCLSKFNIVGQGTNFNAEIVLNNIRYEGEGTTKAAAKLDASEKAFRDLILFKMTQKHKRDITKQGNIHVMVLMNISITLQYWADTDGDTIMETDPEEEIPMVHLASFALHKLFSEWEAEGFSVPDLRGGPQIAPIQSGLGSVSIYCLSGWLKNTNFYLFSKPGRAITTTWEDSIYSHWTSGKSWNITPLYAVIYSNI